MKDVPQPTIERLVIYYRYLKKLVAIDEEKVIPSLKLGKSVGVSAAQVRKDLSYFGEFGCKGVGYNVRTLKLCLERILGFNKSWPIILVGAGNLGRALVNYHGFKMMGFHIVEIFDCDLNKIGNRVGGLTVRSTKEIATFVNEKNIKIAVVAVPADEAQIVAEKLVDSGIKAIWNFAPVILKMNKDVIVYYEDMACSLVSLAYRLQHNSLDEDNRETNIQF